MFIAAFVPLAALLFTSYFEIRNGLAAQVQDHLVYNAHVIANNIEVRIARSRAMLHVLSNSQSIGAEVHPSRSAIEEEMKRIQLYFGSFDDLTLLRNNGQVLASTAAISPNEWVGQSWFLKAREGKDVLGRAYLLPKRKTSVAAMCIPTPKHRDWLLCGRLALQAGRRAGEETPFSIGDVLLDAPLSEYMQAFLINDHGRMLVHIDPARRFEELPADDLVRTLLAAGGGRLWDKTGRGAFYAVVFVRDSAQIMDEHWAVVVSASAPEALAPLGGYYSGMIVAALFALVLAVALSVFFSHSFSEPIRRLMTAVNRLATGDLTARVHVRGRHELAALGRHFNSMAEDLAEAMQKIRESEQRFRTLVETAGEGIWAVDHRGVIVHANPALERICGAEGMLGGAISSYIEIAEPHDAKIDELINPPVPSQEMLWRTVNGREVWVIYAARRLEPGGRNEAITFAIITDITERKSMEHQLARYSQNLERMVEERTNQVAEKSRLLEEALARAEKADRSKSEYISRMSHEIRTPLNSIMGFADLSLMGVSGEVSEKVRHDLKIIKDSAQYLLKMINDILDVAKIQAGMLDLEIKDLNAAPIAARVLESVQGVVGKKDLTLRNEVGSDECWVRADDMRLQQVLNNLLSNAIKYTDQGHVRLAAERQDEFWRFVVEDTGIGIPATELPQLFEEFRQVKGTGREGSGLGLALVRLLVEKMGGRVWAESQEGVGSKFYFTLPAGQPTEMLKRKKNRWLAAQPPRRIAVLAADPAVGDFLVRELLLADINRVELLSVPSAARDLAALRPEVVILAPFAPHSDLLTVVSSLESEDAFREANAVLVAVDPRDGTGHAMGMTDILTSPVADSRLKQLLALFDHRPQRLLLAQDRFEEAVQTSNLLRGYDIEVVKAFTQADALELLENVVFDCVMVDVSLGAGQGLLLLDRLQQRFAHVPTIVLAPRQLSDDLRQSLADVAAKKWPHEKLTASKLYGGA